MEEYLYNPKTNTLHIRGYCQHTKGHCQGYMHFNSENAALAYGGRAVGVCKLCQRRREQILNTEGNRNGS